MLAPTSATDAGKRLRAARECLCLSIREVEDLSRQISLKMNAPDYFISRTWLGALEAGKLKLNIYRLKSLSLIYRLGLDEILSFFGVDICDVSTEQKLVGLPHTYLVTPTLGGARSTLVAPLELREKVDFGSTNLVSRMFESWGEIPITLLQHMDWRNSLTVTSGSKTARFTQCCGPVRLCRSTPSKRRSSPAVGTTNSRDQSILWSFEIPLYAVGAK